MSLQQLSKLLPLPEEDLQQVLAYASTLPPQEAVEHFNNLLGETITAEQQPQPPRPTQEDTNSSTPPTARSSRAPDLRSPQKTIQRPNNLRLLARAVLVRPTKISITGGTPVRSASANLSELDALIYSLENASTSAVSNASRACNCIATKHALLAAAPNCLNCGKVICVKEGFGPCTFCGQPILRPEDRDNIVRELRADRAQEKQAIDRAAHRRVETTKNPYVSRAAAVPAGPTPAELSRGDGEGLSAAEKAQAHRDRLLGFQAQNASRTRVYDEAADFATPDVGVSQWAGPMERARMLKQQQKVLREQEWNAKPEYEKKREMVSLDVVGGKLVKTYKRVDVKYHDTVQDKENIDEGEGMDAGGYEQADARTSGGAYNDYDDNEEVILDGGVYGSSSMLEGDMREGGDEEAGTGDAMGGQAVPRRRDA
ncbi:hypothetical protein VE04_09334 [Pseudogymnoascus sp. 24MN13]|nr:hypothetical protein VE04_09334 [Pseudogymnoascus sp. 24MN13]